jgi:hypothetical protein
VAAKLTVSNNGHVTDVDGAARACQYTSPSQFSSQRMCLRVHQTADLLDGELNHDGGVVWVSLLKSFTWRAPLSV